MLFGNFRLRAFEFGLFRLDGGAMFGSVPKNLWAKVIPADEENCIGLTTRSLYLEHRDRRFLIDVGMGEKWSDKHRAMYGIRNTPEPSWGIDRLAVTDVILTHLHFDHAGGITRYSPSGELELSFPNARVHLQRANWDHGRAPTLKDRASYLAENIAPLEKADLLLCDGDVELYPGIRVHRVDGHTRGQQWVEIEGDGDVIFYPTDLVPTAHHVPLAYHMGYDICAETLLGEKSAFLEEAVRRNALVVFEHDRVTAAARIGYNDKGQFAVKEAVSLD